MRWFGFVLVLMVGSVLGSAQAMPPAVLTVLQRADDHPRQALADLQQMLQSAATTDADLRYWLTLGVARVQSRLERHAASLQATSDAADQLARLPAATDVHRLWLELAQLDNQVLDKGPLSVLPRLGALRQRAQALSLPALNCEALQQESFALLELHSEDEAWQAADALERCGQALGWPEAVAAARLSRATLLRQHVGESPDSHAQASAHLDAARQALGDRPARFVRSLIEWEAGIQLRHRRQLEAALSRLRLARTYSQELGDDAGMAAADIEQAAVLLEGGQAADMLPLLDTAVQRLQADDADDMHFRMGRVIELRLQALTQMRSPLLTAEVERARDWVRREVTHDTRARLHAALARALASQGRYAAAYDTLLAAEAAATKARAEGRDAQLLRLQARFDASRRDAENAELRLRSETARLALEAETERRRALTAGLVALAALSLLALSFGWRQFARRRRLARLALRDELTGMPNRRAVQTYAREQLAQAARLGLPMTVALIDFDHFKRINDEHGHAAGDAVLRAFARLAPGVLRGHDRLGRWGGEEWLLVMPGTRLDEANSVFQRLRRRLARADIPGLPQGWRCTFSMGAAAAEPGSRDLDATIARADRALYRAKQAGRDRLELDAG